MKSIIFNYSHNVFFYILLAFLLLINFSIAGCYVLFSLLAVGFILNFRDRSATFRLPGYFKWFLIYSFFSLLSTIFSIDKLNSLKENKELLVFLLIPIIAMLINSNKRLLISLITVLVSASISSLVGIASILKEGISLDNRLRGFTSHWMTYSGLLMMVFLFFLILLFYLKSKKGKITIAVTLLVILSAILLSLTRSMWLGITISIGIFLIYTRPKLFVLVIPLAAISFLLLPQSVKERILSTVDPNNETNRDRIHMVFTGVEIFKDYPLTGVGANNVESVYDNYRHPDAVQSNPHLHNNIIQILAERGIFAAISLLLAYFFILRELIQRARGSGGLQKILCFGTMFVFIGFIVSGLTEYNFGDSEIKFLLFYFLTIPFLQIEDWNDDLVKTV